MGLRSRFADNEADGGFMEAIQWIGAGVLFFLVGGFIVFAFRQGMKVRPRATAAEPKDLVSVRRPGLSG
jgi:hypothetical protein